MPDTAAVIETDIPARLDRLPWTRFHTLVVVALGITWILDGLEVTLGRLDRRRAAGKPGAAIRRGRGRPRRQRLSRPARSSGAVLFGYLTDRFGRRQLFMVTLGLYLAATAATAGSWNFCELCAVPLSDRRRHRRRIRGDQLGDPGVHPGALSRPHRPWRSTAASGSARRSVRPAPSSFCSPACCRRIGAGAPLSGSAPCSASASCCCAASSRRARAG